MEDRVLGKMKYLSDIVNYMAIIYVGVVLPNVFRNVILRINMDNPFFQANENFLFSLTGSLLIIFVILLMDAADSSKYLILKYLIAFGIFYFCMVYLDSNIKTYYSFRSDRSLTVFIFTSVMLLILQIIRNSIITNGKIFLILLVIGIAIYFSSTYKFNKNQEEYAESLHQSYIEQEKHDKEEIKTTNKSATYHF